MVVKRGTGCVVDYTVYAFGDKGASVNDEWVLLEESSVDLSALQVVDHRTLFRFRFGMGEIPAPLERLIGDHVHVTARNGDKLFVVSRQDEAIKLHMSLDEIFLELLTLKSLGNELLKSGSLDAAYATYTEAIALMTSPDFNRRTAKDIAELFTPLLLNKALCCLKLQKFGECIDSCSQVLEVNRNNVKALYRRGVARIENKELGPGKRDLLCALDVDPKNADVIQQLERLKVVNDDERKLYSKMVTSATAGVPGSRVKLTLVVDGKESSFEIELKDSEVPKTTENFKMLLPSFPGCEVFKLVKDQFFQTGDFEYNDGSGGNCALEPDRTVRNRRFLNDENLTGKHDKKGVVGMSNYGPNSNGTQFYITLGPCPHLDGKHVVFGHVVSGMEVLDEINALASDRVLETKPRSPIILKSVDLVRE